MYCEYHDKLTGVEFEEIKIGLTYMLYPTAIQYERNVVSIFQLVLNLLEIGLDAFHLDAPPHYTELLKSFVVFITVFRFS